MEPLSPDSAPTFYVMRTLRRHWRLIVLVTIIFAAAAGVYELIAAPTYASSATVQVKPLVGNAFSPDTASNSTVALETEAQLVGITDRTLLTDAAKIDSASNPARTAQTIAAVTKPLDTIQHWSCTRSHVAAAVLTNAFLIKVTYTSHSAATAEACAESFAQAFLNYRHALTVRTQNTQATSLNTSALHAAAKLQTARNLPLSNPDRATQIAQYTTSLSSLQSQISSVLSQPSSPGTFIVAAQAGKTSGVKPLLVVVGAGVLGLIVGVLLALARGRRDRRILTETNERSLGLPVLATVVTSRKAPIGTPLPDLAADEAFRIAAISVLANADAHSAVAVAPLSAHESSAGVAIRLARGIAAAGYSVVLVDAVTDGPQVGALLDMEPQSGLSDIIDGAGFDTVNVIDVDGLEVLAAGTDPSGSRQRYAGGRIRDLLTELKRATDYVVISTSAITSADGLGVLLAAEHAVVVVDDHNTTYEDIAEMRTLAGRLDVNVTGLVVSRIAHVGSSPAPAVSSRRGRELPPPIVVEPDAGARPEITGAGSRRRGTTRTKP
jgi:capsular polysaccharide biosynthesis protein